MRHARDEDLDAVETLIAHVRKLPGLTERKRGTFYRKSEGFLHFHRFPWSPSQATAPAAPVGQAAAAADPAGMFADLECRLP